MTLLYDASRCDIQHHTNDHHGLQLTIDELASEALKRPTHCFQEANHTRALSKTGTVVQILLR